ncbi:hypothetical protein [Streptomyces kronopolitis]|uniref:hypothetical protein n=1 Tax=Streptomyces kronopolitis TaxID=1612435 RepID=UPI00341A5881
MRDEERVLVSPKNLFPTRKLFPMVHVGEDAARALREVERQRVTMADKVRLPWWFLFLFAVSSGVTVASPSLEVVYGSLGVLQSFLYVLLGLLLVPLLLWFRLRSGLHILRESRPYPSMKDPRRVFALMSVVVLGYLVALWPYLFGLPWISLACSVPYGCLFADQLRRTTAAIRDDIRAGRRVNG